jgi:DNA-binding NarL/FixJ family response regulator
MSLEEVVAYARDPLAALPRSVADQPAIVRVPENELLSPREREVAGLVARGLSNAQIAEQLVIGQRTVAAHVEHILNKLGFASRTQVGVWAAEHGLLAPSSG